MKTPTYILILALVLTNFNLFAQEKALHSDTKDLNYLERSPIYDYSELQLTDTDTIPDFAIKENQLKITGTIYENDGVTPAKNVILFIYQTDENGDYDLKTQGEKRYVNHRGWVKTNEDGQYTFYTFVPGTVNRSNEFMHIHAMIKEDGKDEQQIDPYLFDNDPMLTKKCRNKLQRKGITSILKLEKKDKLLVANRDIVLENPNSNYEQ